jgi:uncharacterized protein YgiM (DUF1202 family)
MKKNLWIIFAAALSTSLLAQDMTNSAPVLQAPPPEPTPMTPAPSAQGMPAMPAMEAPTNAPAAPKKAKPAARKKTTSKKTAATHKAKAPELKTVPLIPGPAVVSANHVNVRTKAGLIGEVLTHMTNGESVIVIEELNLKKSGPDEPSAWAKIALPPEAHVWVKSSLLDSNNTVASKKVNLRGGPGEAYGVVGTLQKGDAITVIDTKGEWTQIQAPTNAYAFMAAQYLKQGGEEAPAVAAMPTPEPAPTTTMPEMPGMAPATGETPTATTDTNPAPVAAEAPMPAPSVQEPPPERIVEHEGIVRGTFSIQAPTRYQLVSPDTKVPINYLYTPSTNLDLGRYKGMHIIVTGEEGLDARWKNTPVITIQKIQVLD